MPSTYTSRNRLEKQNPGENTDTWGARLNGNVIDLVDEGMDGVYSFSLSGSLTLSTANAASDQARKRVLNVTGGTGGTITIPNLEKNYVVRNASSADVTITTGAGTTHAVKSGNVQQIFCDGASNVFPILTRDFGANNITTTGTVTCGVLSATTITNTATGTPLTVNSTNSAAAKIALQDNGSTKGYVGSAISGATLCDSGGTPRITAATAGASVTGTFSTTGDATINTNVLLSNQGGTIGRVELTGTTPLMVHTPSAWSGSQFLLISGVNGSLLAGNNTAAVVPSGKAFVVQEGTAQLFWAQAGHLYCPAVATTASAGNAFLNSGSSPANELLRSTSSRVYKTDVEDVEAQYAAAALKLRPVYYRSNPETCPGDDPSHSHWGYIAEEVAAIDPRLVHWGYQDDDYEVVEVGTNGESGEPVTQRQLKADARLKPDGAQYERIHVLMIHALKLEIEALKGEIAALKAA